MPLQFSERACTLRCRISSWHYAASKLSRIEVISVITNQGESTRTGGISVLITMSGLTCYAGTVRRRQNDSRCQAQGVVNDRFDVGGQTAGSLLHSGSCCTAFQSVHHKVRCVVACADAYRKGLVA